MESITFIYVEAKHNNVLLINNLITRNYGQRVRKKGTFPP